MMKIRLAKEARIRCLERYETCIDTTFFTRKNTRDIPVMADNTVITNLNTIANLVPYTKRTVEK